MKYYLLLLITASTLTGCVSSEGIGTSEDVWVANTTNILGLFYSSDYLYCRSNKSENGKSVTPICYQAIQVGESRRFVPPEQK